MKAGPKRAVDDSVLPFRPRSNGSARFAAFCEKFVKVRESKRVGRAAVAAVAARFVRCWTLTLRRALQVGACHEGKANRRLSLLLGVYELMTGGEGATVNCRRRG